MNIIIIGSARTKSTALLEKLSLENPTLKNWGEPIEPILISSSQYIIKNKNTYFTKRLKKLFSNFSTNDNIVKILGNNFYGKTNYIEQLSLDKFDKIYLLERHDFFDQLCSFTVARKENVFHRNYANNFLYEKIKTKKYVIKKFLTNQLAHSIGHYLDIKKFIIENNLSYIQYNYEDLNIIQNVRQTPIDLDYSKIIDNYHLKDEINKSFYKFYNYTNCMFDFESFQKEIDILLF